MEKYYSNGKLLISGEYVVLDGAKALAIPTRYGQSMEITPADADGIKWESFDDEGNKWLDLNIKYADLDTNDPIDSSKPEESIKAILREAKKLNSSFLLERQGLHVQCHLTFPRDWGLGSSSTLITNLANWANINPYTLLKRTFGGSGYDIACAKSNSPITYQITADKSIAVNQIEFSPPFRDNLFFVHLNQKQNTQKQIGYYRNLNPEDSKLAERISDITEYMVVCATLSDFRKLIDQHEALIAKMLGTQTIKEERFPDFEGSIKSLGAWGGDFIMVASEGYLQPYFRDKGYHTIIKYEEMILK